MLQPTQPSLKLAGAIEELLANTHLDWLALALIHSAHLALLHAPHRLIWMQPNWNGAQLLPLLRQPPSAAVDWASVRMPCKHMHWSKWPRAMKHGLGQH